MGKSNRIRANHAEKKIVTPVKTKQKKGMPLWLKSAFAGIIAVAVLLVCVMGALSSNGVLKRHNKALSTENFKISENMLSYIFQNQYANFTASYSEQLASIGLDTTKSLKEQTYGESTWHDYFLNSSIEEASQILRFCEEAYARGIELDDADMAAIDAEIDSIKQTATLYGYTGDSYISYNYGEGIKLKDVRKIMELSELANKAMLAVQEEIEANITDADISAAYDKDAKTFNSIDYSYFSVNVNYKTIAAEVLGKTDYTDAELKEKEADVLAKYTEEILAAKKVVDELGGFKTADEFNKHLFELLAEDYYDDDYAKIELEASEIPEETVVDSIKEIVLAKILENILSDKSEIASVYAVNENVYTIGEHTVTEKFAKFVDSVQSSVYRDLLTDKETYVVEKGAFKANDEFSTWAFDAARAVGDTKKILNGDGKDSDTVENKTGSFSAVVYILTKPQYRDNALSKNFDYVIFSTEANAKAAIEKFAAGELTAEHLFAAGEENSATGSSTYESYLAGHLGVEAFDTWLFDAETKVGDYTKAPIKIDDSNYLIAYYSGDSIANWQVNVKANLFSTKYTEFTTEIPNKYAVELKESVIDNIELNAPHNH